MQVDGQGYLSAENGERLAVGIQIPPDLVELELSEKGLLTGVLEGGESIELGQLSLVNFSNNEQLDALGNNLFSAKSEMMNSVVYGTPGESGLGTTMQGMRELSNVSLNEEMMSMMLGLCKRTSQSIIVSLAKHSSSTAQVGLKTAWAVSPRRAAAPTRSNEPLNCSIAGWRYT